MPKHKTEVNGPEDIRVCPSCLARTAVVDSRPAPGRIRRRHRCPECNHSWTTMEVVEPEKLVKGMRVMFVSDHERRIIESYRKSFE